MQVRRRIARREREHAVELLLGELEPARPDVERRVVAHHRAHAEVEVLGAPHRAGRRGRGGVLRAEELAGRLDPLGEPRVAAEEERLEAPAVLRLAPQELEDPGRLLRVVAGADEPLHALGVRLALEVAAVAVDRGDRGELEADAEDHVGGLAQDGGAHVVARARARARGDRDADGRGGAQDRVEDLLVPRVAVEAQRVPVGDVRRLVAQDHRELGLVVEPREQPRVHVDAAVRHRERVERRVAHDAEPEARPARGLHLGRQEAVADAPQVLLEQRIVVDLDALEELLLLLLGLRPELPLVGLGLEGPAARADRRHAARGARAREERDDEDPGDRAEHRVSLRHTPSLLRERPCSRASWLSSARPGSGGRAAAPHAPAWRPSRSARRGGSAPTPRRRAGAGPG